jgi:hypothetical protein
MTLSVSILYTLWRVDPFLGSYGEANNETIFAARQQITISKNIIIIIIIIIIYFFILTANGFVPGSSGTAIRHNTQITHITQKTHHTQTKYRTQNYTNNKGHTTHNDNYNKYNCNYNYITAASERLGKHVPAATDTHETEERCVHAVRAKELYGRQLGQPNQFCMGV